ncbi:MAG: response regulator transcription factor [Alphaproteobacteria bacterium]|nr:response regulator transcription factor [Alphaproteobacteria bacterium]
MHVLLIDRKPSINQGIAFFFKSKGWVVDTAFSGEEGAELARLYDYDLILSDLLLSDITGAEVIKKIRNVGIKTPITIISGSVPVSQKINCFNLGADDFIVRPCDRNELMARIQAIVRRAKGYANSVIKIGQMTVNLDTKIITIAGATLKLTKKEYALLELLALRQNMTVSKEQLLNHLYGAMDEPDIKILDVFLFRIRNKIDKISNGKKYIQTVWGRGYILKESE